VSAYEHIAQRQSQLPVRNSAKCCGSRQAHTPLASGSTSPPPPNRPSKPSCVTHLPKPSRAKVHGRYGPSYTPKTIGWSSLRALLPSAFVPRTTGSGTALRAVPERLLGQPAPPLPIKCGSATSRTYSGRAAAGSTWPCGRTVARAKSWVGTCAKRCPKPSHRGLATASSGARDAFRPRHPVRGHRL
jgi:hypothetical protein